MHQHLWIPGGSATTPTRCSTVPNLPVAVAPRWASAGPANHHDLVTAKMLAREQPDGRRGSHRLKKEKN